MSSQRLMQMSTTTAPIGFIGLGIMGEGMAKNLLQGGRDLLVWNRSAEKAQDFMLKYKDGGEGMGKVEVATSPMEVIQKTDVTFSMLSTPEAARSVFFAPDGVLAGIEKGKMIVDCATLTVADVVSMHDSVVEKGGLYLEAPVSGSKIPAANGQLIFLCGGSDELYSKVKDELSLMGKADYYLGGIGKGTEMKLVVNMIMGTMLTSLAEGMCLSDSLGLDNTQLIEILGLGAMANPMFAGKGPLMDKKNYAPNFPLKHAQKDMRFALGLGEQTGQALPVSAAANAAYLKVREEYGDLDFCAVIEAFRQAKK